MMWSAVLISILIFAIQGPFCHSMKAGCPEPEDVFPCRCSKHEESRGTLHCDHISSDDMKNVLERSKNYEFNRILIRNSKLQYLPHNLFEDLVVYQMVLSNLSLATIFDRPPTSGKLDILMLQKVVSDRGSVLDILRPLKLRALYVRDLPMRTVGMDFILGAPQNLTTLHFFNTNTENIETGVFNNFTRLKELRFINGSIKRLAREMFPRPFNVNYLSFDHQKLTEIQEGIFTDMPNLRHLTLDGNQIATIPEKAFDSDFKFYDVLLNDNPIKCDCRFKWVVFKGLPVRGLCASPKRLQGKRLDQLSRAYFYNC